MLSLKKKLGKKGRFAKVSTYPMDVSHYNFIRFGLTSAKALQTASWFPRETHRCFAVPKSNAFTLKTPDISHVRWCLFGRVGVLESLRIPILERRSHRIITPRSDFITWIFIIIDYIHGHGCARWGASGALYPKSALCGAEFPLKGLNLGAYKSSWSAAAQQTVTNLVRSGRKQR